MKLCVFGAGAIGGHLAARLAHVHGTAHEVSMVARGEHLAAVRRDGLHLDSIAGDVHARPGVATDDPATLPPQDVVFVTLKAVAQPGAAEAVARLLGDEGVAVYVGNGIPWWWNAGRPGADGPLPLLDPQGALWSRVGPARTIGVVVYSGNEVIRPGVVRHRGNNRWLLGEPRAAQPERLARVAALMREAGLVVEVSADIRREVWLKLLRNVPLNALCALTRLATDELAAEPGLAETAARAVDEAVAVAAAQGMDLSAEAPAARAAFAPGGALRAPGFKGVRPSMLQDVEGGRPTEVDAILGQVAAFGREAGVATPTIDVLLALVRGLDRTRRAG
jgi:2-dehydropantoate 2-reductase